MADINLFLREYSSFNSTFKETSFDDNNNIHLCKDESQEVINFDKILKSKYPDSNKRPKSFDAIYIYDDTIFCIEFKNQKPSYIDNSEIKDKLVNGKKELIKFLQNLNIQVRNYNITFCVVYKNCNEPFERYKCGIGKDRILFGLEEYKYNGFVNEIFTNNVSFYTKQFKKLTKKELVC